MDAANEVSSVFSATATFASIVGLVCAKSAREADQKMDGADKQNRLELVSICSDNVI
jgi:hypothetical protein